MANALQILHRQIDARVLAIKEQHGAWPCREGCDHCCRRLAAPPVLTDAERELLRQGLSTLPDEVSQAVERRWEAMNGAERPIICPLLDTNKGMCLIYEYRPVACRTYGFYVERDRGLYCTQIETMVERGECEDVVWGNQAAVESALLCLQNGMDSGGASH
jgi:uncharacterized protein